MNNSASSILTDIVAHKRQELEAYDAEAMLTQWMAQLTPTDEKFLTALQTPGQHIIAEIKPASPSAGVMRASLDLDQILPIYQRYATAISVLTDRKYFQGDPKRMQVVRQTTGLPVLCKDFILSELQVIEARFYDADAVLLIAKILEKEQFETLYWEIRRWGMTPVVEVQNQTELAMVLPKLQQDRHGVLLINNRNLDTMAIDLKTTPSLVESLSDFALPVISASGIESRQDLNLLLPYCQNFLIGSALMKSENIAETFRELLGS